MSVWNVDQNVFFKASRLENLDHRIAGKMNAEEEFQFFAEMDRVGEMVGRLFRRHPFLSRILREVSLTWWGGRLLYSVFLQPVASNCLSLMAEVDR